MSLQCRRCENNDFIKGCSKNNSKYNYQCFTERILKIYDSEKSTDGYLELYGPYGDALRPVEIENEIKRLNRLKDSMLVRVGV